MRDPSPAVEQHLRQLTILCFAIFMGVVIFGGVVWYLMTSGTFTPPEGMPSYLGLLFNLVALVAILKAFFLPRLFPRPSRDAPEEDVLAWHKRTTLVGFALREGAAFIALVGVLLSGQMSGGYAMAGLAVVTMALAWPKADHLEGGL